MTSLIQRFLSFERLIGPTLVRIVYYVGLAAIVAFAGFTAMMALMALFGGNIGQGVMMLIAAPAVGAVALVYWRFVCELFMLAFMGLERLTEVRDLMRIAAGAPPAPDPDHPAF